MARLRDSGPPPAAEPVLSDGDRWLFRRRMRACTVCGERSDWTLDDVGPLCGAHLAELGVMAPLSTPVGAAVVVRPGVL